MSHFRKKQCFLVSIFHDCSSWEDWDVPIDLTCLLAPGVDKKCAAILNILLCRCPVHLSMGNSQGTRVFIVSQWKFSIGQPLSCLLSMDNGHPLIASTLNPPLLSSLVFFPFWFFFRLKKNIFSRQSYKKEKGNLF